MIVMYLVNCLIESIYIIVYGIVIKSTTVL